jgi:very-short-patch-repair endonuclease
VARGLVHLSAVEGRPSPTSEVEQRIEARLRECSWAAGRAWNRRFSAGSLAFPIFPDLIFEQSRLVVEFDGLDHLNRTKYEADRQRDRILQRCGYAVFRFTNSEVALDIERVIGEIAAEVARRIS